ncbi:Gfo/Idh/MocA family oxidoreductase [Roseomonas xinghualingensis]|uniref:Gfo/Idh/MocA family oxidoreductase n=1 Tax=Roseomonas xinghualingensis TaxID=2986475 RepID=UPI0021F0B889|nr:Gfo/Idh/MocA family oxidoreductase [Roseomonas sp. SXEYE001]MCV4209101.1 Gfo/Idh/MocA family oxidoreductase [Roseomonas sp. SXEYE001]
MAAECIRLGVAGLGRAFVLMLPTLVRHPHVQLVAAADPRPEARARFTDDFGARSYDSVEALCADPVVDAVYIATPHQFHLAHVRIAAAARKHVLVEKPMALSVEDCLAMIDAARRGGIHLIVGHSHSFGAPYLRTREMIRSGEFGALRMITAVNFTDYLYRPRRPEELDTVQGGGAIFSQAPHQVEVARLLAGRPARAIRAHASIWDRARGTEGAYTALLDFGGGLAATLTYNGHGHFDTDEFQNWTGEMGTARDPATYATARAALRGVTSPKEEAALKEKRAYGAGIGAEYARRAPLPSAHNHFGLFIASCDRADLRPMANGVMVYGDDERRLDALPPPTVPRAEVIDELFAAVVRGQTPLHSGEWGLATAEICLAILESARTGRDIPLRYQNLA